MRTMLLVAGLLAFAGALTAVPAAGRHQVLADFESGSVTLTSYPDEDRDPNSWELQTQNTYGGSDYALRLWGNTWKQMALAPYALTEGSVFEAAVYLVQKGEMQAVGFGDNSGNILFYCVGGTQLSLSDRWNVVYQGFYDTGEWHTYRFAVGRDWNDTWHYQPQITKIVFVNDRDNSPRGETIFDEIYDVTGDLPVAPIVEIQQVVGPARELPSEGTGPTRYRVDVQFGALVEDPDSPTHTYLWDFGDGTRSTEAEPLHGFTVESYHTFTVGLDVTDETGLVGRDTTQVWVEPGGDGGSSSINFTGDVFLGRGYDQEGGLIDTYGVDYLFAPTRPMLGLDADVTMVNAECAFTDRGTPHPTKSVVFRTRPQNVEGLVYAGVDIASTANNHIVDYGCEGLEQTHAVFDSVGLVHAGSGVDEYFALQPCYYTQQGVRLGFVNQCNRTGRQGNEQPFLDAGYDKCGLGYWLEPNMDRSLAQADSLADIVIAFPHSGEEYAPMPPDRSGRDSAGVRARDPELCPPFVATAQAADPDFRIWPGLTDRELRRHAIDQGADAVLNSHPHVLQGFEVYQGALIAHSLGNFMFDLSYPETMPSMVLRATFDKRGIMGWTFRPVFIDQWIPKPASGRLGREILDRVADYSRVLGASVGVYPATMSGRVFLDPLQADPVVSVSQGTRPFALAEDGSYVSLPIELAGKGSLSRITDAPGLPAGAQVRFGREVLWFGRFEQDEGYHMWSLDSSDEWLDDAIFQEGAHSLTQHRRSSDGGEVTTLLDRHLPAADSLAYGLTGWMRTDNAAGARFALRFYSSRYTWNAMTTLNAVEGVDGTTDWTWYGKDFAAPDGATFLNVRCRLDCPAHDEARAWFDDLRVIEWQPWQELTLPLAVPYPNNLRFVEVRLPQAQGTATVVYEETVLSDEMMTAVPEPPESRPVDIRWAGATPNPFATGTTLRYRLGATARVDLAVFDPAGRVVDHLVRGEAQRPGWHRVSWPDRDVPAGVYFVRLTAGGRTCTNRLIRVR
jgi:poly-gamma-glutamate capsule biosynthesis protein CapA/YwtB (metallophosphatase superfamily)